MARSRCNKTPVVDCASSGCVVVRRGGSPHHCRSFPSKKNANGSQTTRKIIVKTKSSPRPQKPSTPSRVNSTKRKILKGLAANRKRCSTFSLEQRNATCYLAASTLLFGRVALSECKDADVRAFVRRTMANAWDDAQGDATDLTCPRIPKKIRDYYFACEKFLVYTDIVNVFTVDDAGCVKKGTCGGGNLATGGNPENFLAALLWASGISSEIAKTVCEFVDPARNFLLEGGPFLANGKTLTTFMKRIIADSNPKVKYHLINFLFSKSKPRNPQQAAAVENFLVDCTYAAVEKGYLLQGVLMSLRDRGEKKGHTVSVFPCVSQGHINWIGCNSWGDSCSPTFSELMRGLRRKGFVLFTGITIVLKRA